MNAAGTPGPSPGGAEPPDQWELARRMAVLETRFDTVLPTLVTKSDLAELRTEILVRLEQIRTEFLTGQEALRTEIHRMQANLLKWMVATVIALFIGFAGLFFGISGSLQRAPGSASAYGSANAAVAAAPVVDSQQEAVAISK